MSELLIMADSRLAGPCAATVNARQPLEFRYFQSLPKEIRDMIWQLNLPGPRVLRLQSKSEFRSMGPKVKGRFAGSKKIRLVTGCTPPINLWICFESRKRTLREYRLAFGTGTSPPQTYINFQIDTVIFDKVGQFFPTAYTAPRPRQLILHDEFKQLHHLAIRESFTWTGPIISFQHFPNLKSIELITSTRTSKKIKNGTYALKDTSDPAPFVSRGHFFQEQWNKSWTERMVDLWKCDEIHQAPHISRKTLLRGSRAASETKRVWLAEGELPNQSFGEYMTI
jgi:hypothetical protein